MMSIDYGGAESLVKDLCSCAVEINKSCGIHVHLGRPDLGGGNPNKSFWEPERVRTFLIIGHLLEEKLFGLCPASRRDNQYCKKIAESYQDGRDFKQFYPVGQVQARKYENPKRYCWLNLIETRRVGTDAPGRAAGPGLGTIEVRMLGNVRRFEYIWAWVQLWVKIGAYVAYLPSSLAISHCCFSGSLAGDFQRVELAKNAAKRDDKSAEGVKKMVTSDSADF
jgi:hypothetical protein